MVFRVRVKRETQGNDGLELPFAELERVQELLKAVAASEVKDLVVEVRFGAEEEQSTNGKLQEEEERDLIEQSAKYTYG